MAGIRNYTCPLCGTLTLREIDIDRLICPACGNDEGVANKIRTRDSFQLFLVLFSLSAIFVGVLLMFIFGG